MTALKNNSNMHAHALPFTLPFNKDRAYLMVTPTSGGGSVNVEFENGSNFDVKNSERWEPHIAPINSLIITGSGTVVDG